MKHTLPKLSQFELQCFRKISNLGEATIRDVHTQLDDAPSYSTVRKIFERLEAKGAIQRVRLDGKAWVYRPKVSAPKMIRKEVQRLLDVLFDGSASSLVSHLADMDAISLEDLRELEEVLRNDGRSVRESDADGRKEGER